METFVKFSQTTHLKFAGLVYANYISIKKEKFIGDKPLKR